MHLITIFVNNQLDAQFFFLYIFFQFSTCFEQPSAHHRESELYKYALWYMSLYAGDRVVCIPHGHLDRVIYNFCRPMQRITPHSRWWLQDFNWSSVRCSPFSFLKRKNSRHETIILLSPYKLLNNLPLFKTQDVNHWQPSTEIFTFLQWTIRKWQTREFEVGTTLVPSAFIHHSLVFSLRGRVGRNQSPVMWPVWLWHTASWVSSWEYFAIAFLRL